MHDKFLHSKYVKFRTHESSSICLGINHFNDIILKNTFWTIGQSDRVNFWNDHGALPNAFFILWVCLLTKGLPYV